jgi:transposase
VHAVIDGQGFPLVIELTPGPAADSPRAISLLSEAGNWKQAIMDKAYDTNEIRDFITRQKAEACIPSKSNRVTPIAHDKMVYKKRHKIENFFEKLKRARRVATRYEKLDRNYLCFILIDILTLYLREQF